MNEQIKFKAVCYGEVLWDCLPSGKKIGGAPLNVALRLQSLKICTTIISRVGNDMDGRKILSYIEENGVDPLVQVDEELETGKVDVNLDEFGNASYDIKYPSAWDNIVYNEKLADTVKKADVLIYGSLVCRGGESSSTLNRLLQQAKFKVLDINLRKPHYSMDTLLMLMQKADFIKLNEEELLEISQELGLKGNSTAEKMQSLAKKASTSYVCVTKGSQGVILYNEDKYYYNTGFKVKVKDTVGAGDSFLAAFVNQLLKNKKPANALDFACAVGSLVASKEGANSVISSKEIKELMWRD